jgi:hypothetical protein
MNKVFDAKIMYFTNDDALLSAKFWMTLKKMIIVSEVNRPKTMKMFIEPIVWTKHVYIYNESETTCH